MAVPLQDPLGRQLSGRHLLPDMSAPCKPQIHSPPHHKPQPECCVPLQDSLVGNARTVMIAGLSWRCQCTLQVLIRDLDIQDC